MCYAWRVAEIGLREMRQNASDLVRRAQGGEHLTITVSGRPAATLGPPVPARWRRWDDVADVLTGDDDPDWERDRQLIDQRTVSPEL
jgi:prevent-host-death family protein